MKKEAMKFTDSAVELFKEVYDISGGPVVVTELPDVGEEHVVYELRETKIVQSLVPMFNQQMADDGVQGSGRNTFVFNTTKEMQDTLTTITPEEESGDIFLNYITGEDKLIGAVYVKGAWKFTEARKVSSCKFDVGAVLELEDDAYVVILKEYTGEVQGGIGYHGVLFNDEPYLFEQKTTGILLGTPSIGRMILCSCQEELPELPEDVPSEYVFETIPYEKIINYQLLPHNIWYFTPKSEEVTVTSYWIYSNDTWVNVDEIGNYTANQIFVQTVGDYVNRPDKTMTLVEMDTSMEEPTVISEVPYKIIDEEHILFYNVPYNKTLYLCIDESLVFYNTEVNSYDFDIAASISIGDKKYYRFNIGTIGGSIQVNGSTE